MSQRQKGLKNSKICRFLNIREKVKKIREKVKIFVKQSFFNEFR